MTIGCSYCPLIHAPAYRYRPIRVVEHSPSGEVKRVEVWDPDAATSLTAEPVTPLMVVGPCEATICLGSNPNG